MSTSSAFIRRLHVVAAPLVTGGLALLLGACSSTSPSGSSGYIGGSTQRASSEGAHHKTKAPSSLAERPGLGTTLGNEYYDRSTGTQFYRRNSSVPDSMGSFYYNDQEGAKAMSELAGNGSKRGGSFKLAGGKLRASLESYGDKLPWYESGGRIFVVGEAGNNYSISLENPSKERLEVVISVDGLDVLTGTSASASKHGYVIPAGKSIEIEGMRAGGSMRRFQFGSVRDSQAARTGGEKGARNVGVIGVAVYVEDEAAAKMARIKEGMTRGDARAFPGS